MLRRTDRYDFVDLSKGLAWVIRKQKLTHRTLRLSQGSPGAHRAPKVPRQSLVCCKVVICSHFSLVDWGPVGVQHVFICLSVFLVLDPDREQRALR